MLAPHQVSVSGVAVHGFTQSQLTDTVLQLAASTSRPGLVGGNAHVCNLARHDPHLRSFLNSALTYADGQSVVWSARLLGGHLPQRLATTDVARPILAAAAEAGHPVYFFGGAPGVAESAAERLRRSIPGLMIRTHHGYVNEEQTSAVLDDMTRTGTRILFVGLGDPLQQRWVASHLDQLPPVIMTCGGLFDWYSGNHRRAPRWMIAAGLEWLWRLAIEPRRLAKRYLVGNPSFMLAVTRQRLGLGSRGRR
jgi:N-acetylglucosaminyldiphosphoundecaprenol N-acetyl-beta-D-mannosaminyltransferase